VLVGAVTPLMLKTSANPGGLPIEAFDKIRAGVAADRSQFFKDLTTAFFGANRPGAKVSQGVRDAGVHMLTKYGGIGFPQESEYRENLLGNIDAVSIFLDHLDDAVDLASSSLKGCDRFAAFTGTVIHYAPLYPS